MLLSDPNCSNLNINDMSHLKMSSYFWKMLNVLQVLCLKRRFPKKWKVKVMGPTTIWISREIFCSSRWRSDVVLRVRCTNREHPRIKWKLESATTPATILQPFKNKYSNTLSLLILLSRFTKNSKTQKLPNCPALFSLPPCIIEEIFLCMNKLYEILN